VRFSRRARSLTASRTSSSNDSVVRMHLMLVHQRGGRDQQRGNQGLPSSCLQGLGLPPQVGPVE
jgi:hypothetical protein